MIKTHKGYITSNNQKRKMKHRNETFIIAIHYDNKGRERRRRREVSYSHHGRCDVNVQVTCMYLRMG